jgi:hypothetical protein
MDLGQVCGEVEKTIRRSEVEAVVRALRAGNPPRLGQVIDYTIDPQGGHAAALRALGSRLSGKRHKPYRLAVEQWHLEAARLVIDAERRKSRR